LIHLVEAMIPLFEKILQAQSGPSSGGYRPFGIGP